MSTKAAILCLFVSFSVVFSDETFASDKSSQVQQLLKEFQEKQCHKLDCSKIQEALRLLRNAEAKQPQPKEKRLSNVIPKPNVSTASNPPQSAALRPLLSAAGIFPNCINSEKALFVSADALDNFHYLLDVPSSGSTPNPTSADAKGASINYTDDSVGGKQTATIDGRISYLLFGAECNPPVALGTTIGDSRRTFINLFGVAPFVASKGTWNEPLPAKLSNSVLQGGGDFELGLSTAGLNPLLFNYFRASPYYQTDYQRKANIVGTDIAWEPVAPRLFLDQGPVMPLFSFFWQFSPEVDYVHVSEAGLTNLSPGDHVWLGDTIRVHFGLLPLNQPIALSSFVENYVAGRLSVIGTAENFYDNVTRVSADYYSGTLQYKLGPCKKSANAQAVTSGESTAASLMATGDCTVSGSSSISFEYDTGLDKDSLVKTRQYLVKFGYAY